VETKRCTCCNIEKPITEFSYHRIDYNRERRRSYCKSCTAASRKGQVATKPEQDGTKPCTGCGQRKPLSEFHWTNRDGYRGRCKQCFKLGVRLLDELYKAGVGKVEVAAKVCTKCGVKKPIDEFRRSTDRRDGYRGVCIDCNNVYERKRYQEKKHLWREGAKRWRERNPERARASNCLRQHRRRASGSLSLDEAELILSRPCELCGTTENLTLAHNIAVSKGGRTSTDNVLCLCQSCNSKMGTRTFEECKGGL